MNQTHQPTTKNTSTSIYKTHPSDSFNNTLEWAKSSSTSTSSTTATSSNYIYYTIIFIAIILFIVLFLILTSNNENNVVQSPIPEADVNVDYVENIDVDENLNNDQISDIPYIVESNLSE